MRGQPVMGIVAGLLKRVVDTHGLPRLAGNRSKSVPPPGTLNRRAGDLQPRIGEPIKMTGPLRLVVFVPEPKLGKRASQARPVLPVGHAERTDVGVQFGAGGGAFEIIGEQQERSQAQGLTGRKDHVVETIVGIRTTDGIECVGERESDREREGFKHGKLRRCRGVGAGILHLFAASQADKEAFAWDHRAVFFGAVHRVDRGRARTHGGMSLAYFGHGG